MRSTIILMLALLLIISGCSTSSSQMETSEKDKLTVVRLSDATKLDPHFITDISSANILYQKVYETLVVPDLDMKPQPGLAKEWEQIDDVTWEFTLREGVYFHDGTVFNADAVKATFDRLLDPKTASPQAEKLGMIDDIEIVDEYTVRFHLSAAYAPLLSILSANEGSIISPKALSENPKKLWEHPVGTGPFAFDYWKPGQEISIKKNEKYWGDKPKINQVVFKVVPEDTTRLAMIETGEAHVNDQVPITEIERIAASETLNLYRADGLGIEFLGFNVQKAPFDQLEVRKAITQAIDRKAVLKGVFQNSGMLANSPMSPKVFGYSDDVKPYDYDLENAKALLQEAGLEGLKVTITTNDRKERINVAEVVQSQLKKIGINAEVEVLEWGAYIEALNNGEHEMFVGGWGNATGDGDYNQFNVFHSSSHGGAGNHTYYNNPEVDRIIEDARKEIDDESRKNLYEQAMKLEMEDAAMIPLRYYEHLAVYHKDVEGLVISPVNYILLNEITIK
ncbi:glutathione ABC transporter substrate-binding protein [Sutcliffiella horikoshii]|uniref:Glutathione ABC transporter substrate-binding protein n=1 Tax=Sutcliffiella horikoshii TaxID=79883 RepID=A0ABN4ZFD2_9BACI|nr:glutathione ABC transporter substrate-binding protein [Sutcliffiella horikoshii]ART75512.1 glutathione ABC transporter substrate-binding protein [Sutcliffiella horikoshii]